MAFLILLVSGISLLSLETSSEFKKYEIFTSPLGVFLILIALTYGIFSAENLGWGIFLTIVIPVITLVSKLKIFPNADIALLTLEFVVFFSVLGIMFLK